MTKPLNTNPAADVPANWTTGQIVSPSGSDVGLTAKHGYNYQAGKINEALTAIGTINNAFAGIATVYSGSGTPSSATGANGDIYIEV